MLTASPERLMRVTRGDAAAVGALTFLRDAIDHTLRAEVINRPHLATWDSLLDYLRASMAFGLIEQVRVLHLNTRNLLVADEVMFSGTIDESALHIREIIRRALELGSSGIIVVHNHPSGDPTPSRADIDVTRKLAHAGSRLGIAVHDHIIVATEGYSSLRAMGLL